MKKTIILICISFSLTGCFDKKIEGEYPVIDVVNSAGKYQRVYCSDYFSSIELIPLETKKECLLDVFPYHRIVLNDNFIFMWGKSRLFTFDRSGSFLNQIGERGQGPGEYQYPTNYFFNPDKPAICVEDYQKIIEYDFNGNFISSFKKLMMGNFPLSNFSYAGDGLFITTVRYDGENRYKYCLVNQNGDTVKCFPNHIFYNQVEKFSLTYDRSLPPIRVDDRLYLQDYINDTLYVLANSDLQPTYVFGFGEYSLPKERLETRQSSIKYHNTFSFGVASGSLVGTSKFFFYHIVVPDLFPRPKTKPEYNPILNEYMSGGRMVYGIYDIEQKTNILLDTDQHFQKGIINDLNGGLPFIPRYYAGNGLVADVWSAMDMKDILTEKYFASQEIKDTKAHQELKELLKNLKDDDNPVVVIAKLK